MFRYLVRNRRTCPVCRGEVCLSANTASHKGLLDTSVENISTDSVVNDLD